MQSLIRGQKLRLAEISNKLEINIGISVVAPSQLTFDVSCFGVDRQNKLSDDRYFIFITKNHPLVVLF